MACRIRHLSCASFGILNTARTSVLLQALLPQERVLGLFDADTGLYDPETSPVVGRVPGMFRMLGIICNHWVCRCLPINESIR